MCEGDDSVAAVAMALREELIEAGVVCSRVQYADLDGVYAFDVWGNGYVHRSVKAFSECALVCGRGISIREFHYADPSFPDSLIDHVLKWWEESRRHKGAKR